MFRNGLVILFIIIFIPSIIFPCELSLSWIPPTTFADDTPLNAADLAGYKIYYGTASGGYSNSIAVNNTTAYCLQNLTCNTTYYIAATSLDIDGNESVFSNEISKTGISSCTSQDTTAPTVPSSPAVTVNSSSTITYSWTASTDTGTGVAGYKVYRCSGASCTPAYYKSTGYTSISDGGLSSNTSYSYRVSAYDAASPANQSALTTVVKGTTFVLYPITASFTTSISLYTVSLKDTSTATAFPTNAVTVQWGDGMSSTGNAGGTLSHTYATAGTFNIAYTVHDTSGAYNSKTTTVTVPQKVSVTAKLSPALTSSASFILKQNGITKATGTGTASYVFSNLNPGTYQVQIYKKGYKFDGNAGTAGSQNPVTVTVGPDKTVTFTHKP